MKLMVVVELLLKHEYFKTGRNQLRINLAKPDVCAVQSKHNRQENHHRWTICDWQDRSRKA